jgi:hypothetical protein
MDSSIAGLEPSAGMSDAIRLETAAASAVVASSTHAATFVASTDRSARLAFSSRGRR